MRRSIHIRVHIAAAVLLCAATVRADDIKLKDGSKITGTIVGFDDNSFKVQTSYGFAMVRKDQVVSITVSDAPKPDPASSTPAGSVSPPTSVSVGQPPSTVASKPPKTILPSALASPAPKTASPAKSVPAPAIVAPAAASSPAALASVAATPTAPPKPGPIRESVDGSTYVNESYGFRMYKPPDWEVIADAQSFLPGAITALGTVDQTTYLLIGAAPAGKTLAGDIDATDQRLRGAMDNFRPLGESRLNVSGSQAVERKFRGSVDQKDWSGTVVFLSRGGELYTIFGMTLAETDLVQIQENVIARAISSLQFAQ
jgi:hypothetical protein